MICKQTCSIRKMDEAQWDAVTGEVLQMTHRWLRVVEASWRFYQPYYLLMENENGPCAAVLMDTSVAFQKRFGWLGWVYRHVSLVVRTPFSSLCSVVVRPGVSWDSVMPELNAALNQVSKQKRRLLIAVGEVKGADVLNWQKAGFQATPKAGVSILDLPATYEDYLASLHRKQRQELRRVRRRAAEFNIRLESETIDGDLEEVHELLCEVYFRHGASQGDIPFTPQFLTALANEMPDDVLLIRGYAGDRLIGASLNLLDGSTILGLMMGLDYEIARASLLYFVLMDEVIRWGIQQGFQSVFVGRTNEREKRKHGFHLEERWVCHRAHLQPLNWAIRLASQLVQRDDLPPPLRWVKTQG